MKNSSFLEKTFYHPYDNLSTYPRVVQKKRKTKRRKREQEKGNKLRPYLACIDGLYQWSRWCVTGRLHHRLTMPGASNIVSWLYQTWQSQHTPGHHLCQKLCSYMTSHARAQPYYLDCLQSAFSLKIRLVGLGHPAARLQTLVSRGLRLCRSRAVTLQRKTRDCSQSTITGALA